jgi:hypothetical protein
MTQAICRYIGHDAGIISLDQLADSQAAYPFKPYPSPAHLQLEMKLKAAGHAKVELEWPGHKVSMTAVAMEPESITLRKS